MSLKQAIKKSLPGLVSALRKSSLACTIRANRLARTNKRLDLCCWQIAQMLHMAGPPYPQGKVCLEIGSGWVLSHSLALYLAGAAKVIATDLDAMARPGSLAVAARASVPYMVRDSLAPFCNHQEVRSRLDQYLATPAQDLAALERLGIGYRAPLDLAKQRLGEPFDLVISMSVLEHVTIQDVPALLANLWADLSPGGRMIHCIHLEDHLDFQNNPLAFLGGGKEALSASFQATRGNRIRASEWLKLFGELPGARVQALYQYRRHDKPLPQPISPDVIYTDEHDLRTSHLGVLATKRA